MDENIKLLIDQAVDERIQKLIQNVDKNTRKILSGMSDAKWSSFPEATALTGSEKWVGLQAGANVQGNIADLFSPGGSFTPSIVLFNGVNAATGVSGFYVGNSSAGSVIDATFNVLVTSDDSGQRCQLTIETPIPAYFTNTNQALACGLPQIVAVATQNSVGNTASGWGGKVQANTAGSGAIDIFFETAQVSTDYVLWFSCKFILQASPGDRQPYSELKMNAKSLKRLEEIKQEMLGVK